MQRVSIIIGRGFGDEGKGLAVHYFAGQAAEREESCLVVRHNGGAQAGHTVDRPHDRFVFHQLSSGSLQKAASFWADSFLPDLYKLSEEAADFSDAYGFLPPLYADPACRCVCIDDVLLNMALESSRGAQRHGSCGMGIHEAVRRSREPAYHLPLGTVASCGAEELYHILRRIRRDYLPKRMEELSLTWQQTGEYGDLLKNDNVLYNAAEAMRKAVSLLTLTEGHILRQFDSVIFEGAQGLLLDACCERYAPHLTDSRTGLVNPLRLTEVWCPSAGTEAVYVTRSYVTRHGRGPLPYESLFPANRYRIQDPTNQPNPWQERLRLAPHGTPEAFLRPVREDTEGRRLSSVSLMVTHLNETEQCLLTHSGALPLKAWRPLYCPEDLFQHLYLSDSPLSAASVPVIG